MAQELLVVGSGFAGTWAALTAARARALAEREHDVAITVVSPHARLVIRPRLYQADLEGVAPDTAPLFAAVGVAHVAGRVEAIATDGRNVTVRGADGTRWELGYDRLVLAAGSELFMPNIAGLREHAFNVDQLESALALEAHLRSLAARPATAARNTVVVAGGGFTGIETAAEMPARLRAQLGAGADVRVVVVEQASDIGPDLGSTPRPYIEQALAECGVEVITGAAVAAIDARGVTLEDGRRVDADTVIWTAGSRASPLAAQIPAERDAFGRLHADAYLHARGVENVFVTGDVAHAATDDRGNVAMMSCQHALSLGRVAGHNAMAEIVGLPLHAYSQPRYVTCLDLGGWGALYSEGWDRQIRLLRDEAKALKREINTQWIYPPKADRAAAFAVATPDFGIVR